MAAAARQELAQLMNSSGSHKDLAGKCFLFFLLWTDINNLKL
uniref:Uncharacterized protein n=1 Tax=Anas platyrhynchos platyrhynchos TaxID=8840 RepID=A0A493SU72_ANAPP